MNIRELVKDAIAVLHDETFATQMAKMRESADMVEQTLSNMFGPLDDTELTLLTMRFAAKGRASGADVKRVCGDLLLAAGGLSRVEKQVVGLLVAEAITQGNRPSPTNPPSPTRH